MSTPLTVSHDRGPDTPATEDITVADLLRRTAARVPDKAALVIGDEKPSGRTRFTYAALLAEVERCAAALLTRFARGERVAVWAPNVPEWVILQLALANAGLVMVTMNPSLRPGEARFILESSGAAGVFTVPSYGAAAPLDVARALAGELAGLREVVSFADWDEFLRAAGTGTGTGTAGTHAETADRAADCAPAPDDIVQIQYTSGTTGFPKGAMLTHRGVANNAILMAQRAGVTERTVFVRPSLLYHVGGSVASVLMTVAGGGTIIPMTRWSPQLAAELIQVEQATLTGGVPTMMRALLDYARSSGTDISSLDTIILGAAPIPAALVRDLRADLGIRTVTMYGQTESGPTVTMTHLDDRPEDTAETVGTVLPTVEARIVDRESGETVPVGVPGELLIRSPMRMAGYFGKPGQTARAIDDDGWLHTGDLCVMDSRGYVQVVGRVSDMIIRGGANVYPREIEEALLVHPDVAGVAVVGLPDERLGEEVGAFVQLVDGARPTARTFLDYLGDRLARYKIPTRWYAVSEFPLTATGKIQKHVLKERVDSYQPLPAEPHVPTRLRA